MRNSVIFFLFLITSFSLSCGGLKGDFAVRKGMDDSFRKVQHPLEIREGEEVEWVFAFKNASGKQKRIGIILMKKNVVWAEVFTMSENINFEKKTISGRIKDLSEGEYKIVLTEVSKENRLISELEFSVYPSDESD